MESDLASSEDARQRSELPLCRRVTPKRSAHMLNWPNDTKTSCVPSPPLTAMRELEVLTTRSAVSCHSHP